MKYIIHTYKASDFVFDDGDTAMRIAELLYTHGDDLERIEIEVVGERKEENETDIEAFI